MTEEHSIIIADDHEMFLDGVRLILKQQPGLVVAAQALNGAQLLGLLAETPAQLVITDLNMPGMSGIDLVKAIKQRHPDTKVLVISMHSDHELVHEILMAEAEGYILKNSGKKELLEAVNDILNDKTHYEKAVLDMLVESVKKRSRTQSITRPLSAREQEILALILDEYTSKEIADRLFISKLTVDKHRLSIMEKTGAKTLVGLIKYAVQAGLTD